MKTFVPTLSTSWSSQTPRRSGLVVATAEGRRNSLDSPDDARRFRGGRRKGGRTQLACEGPRRRLAVEARRGPPRPVPGRVWDPPHPTLHGRQTHTASVGYRCAPVQRAPGAATVKTYRDQEPAGGRRSPSRSGRLVSRPAANPAPSRSRGDANRGSPQEGGPRGLVTDP